MVFVETPLFTVRVRAVLDDEAYRALQLALGLRPDQGALIPGSGGLRKVRWGLGGRGKRGGLRVIYYGAVGEATILMLYLYTKQEQGDLTSAQLRQLTRLVREEFK